MNNSQPTTESQIYDAVKDLTRADIDARVKRNAPSVGLAVTDEHLQVIERLIDHYKQVCQTQDCHAATPHMRFLSKTYEDKGGSAYLYQLFDRVPSSAANASQLGIITLIHQLVELPSLRYNEDEGFGTVV